MGNATKPDINPAHRKYRKYSQKTEKIKKQATKAAMKSINHTLYNEQYNEG